MDPLFSDPHVTTTTGLLIAVLVGANGPTSRSEVFPKADPRFPNFFALEVTRTAVDIPCFCVVAKVYDPFYPRPPVHFLLILVKKSPHETLQKNFLLDMEWSTAFTALYAIVLPVAIGKSSNSSK